MPHLNFEYAQELEVFVDVAEVLEALHHASVNTGHFHADDIKIRAYPTRHYLVAGSAQLFCHLEVRLLPGRSGTLKAEISQQLLDCLVKHLPPLASISTNVADLADPGYRKISQ
ncbi:5-carboxymethyl-2-hydroxymuconate Delta-isomerase [Ferrimonas pelagia]|uniref:5-carboxymethyl-2-hydroxymuconate isomerase n=1 Tax=Ferrimonas pelagia TaxID=1177826 RepID=A0ABP9FCC3_9GAMM